MKKHLLLLVSAAALAGASFGLGGCAGDAVGVGVDVGPGYYNDGPWAYGNPYYHDPGFYGGGGWRGGWRR